MLEHGVVITPLNSGFGDGLTSMITFEPATHATSEACSILCAEPMSSYFKLRAVSATPYLEPAFFGLGTGDELVIEFDALVTRGTVRSLRVAVRAISSDGTTTGPPLTQMLPSDALAGHFKPFRIPLILREPVVGGEGVLLDIGFDDLNAEVVLRDVVVRVRTRNARFALRNQIVSLTARADYVKNLSLVQRSPIHPAFLGARRLLQDGEIVFADDPATASLTWPEGPARWAGFASYLPACAYPQAVHVYYEACDPAGARSTPGQRTCPVGADLLEDGPERGGVEHAPTDGAWAARFRVFQGAPGSKRLVRADVGAELAGATTRIRNVHFSLPRFDDVPDDRRPNQLDEIFPDLGAVISP